MLYLPTLQANWELVIALICNNPPPHRYGFKSRTGLNFFRALFSLLLEWCSLLRISLSYLFPKPQFIYMIFIYSQFIIVILPSLLPGIEVESYSRIPWICCVLHRRLCHPHIVTFYGAVFRKVPRRFRSSFCIRASRIWFKVLSDRSARKLSCEESCSYDGFDSLGGPSRRSTAVHLWHGWRKCSRWPSVRKCFGREIFYLK